MTKPYFSAAFILVLVFGYTLMSGCETAEEMQAGAIDVSWTVGGTTCTASGVSMVQVSILSSNKVVDTTTAACQLGEATITNLPAGRYTVQVDGYGTDLSYPLYFGMAPNVEVKAGQTTVIPEIEMAEKPGALDLTWSFDNGKICAFAGVDSLDIAIWDNHSNKVYAETLPCDPTVARAIAEMGQPSRSLYDRSVGVVIEGLYAGGYTLRAFAYNSKSSLGAYDYWAEAHPIVEHAMLTPVELVLSPCADMDICF
jgi:hypothetical protein